MSRRHAKRDGIGPYSFRLSLGGMAREDSRPTGMFHSSKMNFENRHSSEEGSNPPGAKGADCKRATIEKRDGRLPFGRQQKNCLFKMEAKWKATREPVTKCLQESRMGKSTSPVRLGEQWNRHERHPLFSILLG